MHSKCSTSTKVPLAHSEYTTEVTITTHENYYKCSSPTSSPTFLDEDKVIQIDAKAMERLFIYPQPEAAKRLGVSLSTLKRRFYELHKNKRWPYSHFKKTLKKRNLSYIVNNKNKPTKQLDPHTINILRKAFTGQLSSNQSSP